MVEGRMRRAVLAVGLWALASMALASCTTAQEIRRPGGRTEFLIACGASTPWSVCYREANKKCPQGYETLSEKGGFNRKEMRVACGPASKP
jgi:hypothetical protein